VAQIAVCSEINTKHNAIGMYKFLMLNLVVRKVVGRLYNCKRTVCHTPSDPVWPIHRRVWKSVFSIFRKCLRTTHRPHWND